MGRRWLDGEAIPPVGGEQTREDGGMIGNGSVVSQAGRTAMV